MKRRIILIAVLMIIAWLALSWFFMWPPVCWRERTTIAFSTCTNNLRVIDDAKGQWARANGKSTGEDVAILEVNKYLKNGTPPICKDGGSYIYGKMGECPIRTRHGHGKVQTNDARLL